MTRKAAEGAGKTAGDDIASVPGAAPKKRPAQIASWRHFIGFLLILAGMMAWGFRVQQAGLGRAGTAASGQLASHSVAIPFYLVALVGDALLFYYCWSGVHNFGGTLATLTGGRWRSWKDAAIDLAITFLFWMIWEATAYGVQRLLGPGDARSTSALLPQSPLEVLIWILVSVNAGFCEEVQTRGYLQQQLHALSGNAAVAVVGQALIFGLMHSYQGWRQVIVISAIGVLYGMLAAWRGNLRANILAHAWSDIWEGWLRAVLWR